MAKRSKKKARKRAPAATRRPKPRRGVKRPLRKAARKAQRKPARHTKAAARRRQLPFLDGISEIRRFFYRNEKPTYFISATNFNLMGTDEWVRNFRFINYIDCFDGAHPNVFVPRETPHRDFTGIEDIVNYLLEHKEVRDYIAARGPGGNAAFLFFDEKTEELCRGLGLRVLFPPARLRREVDDKVNATRIGNRAGVESVPNVLARVDSYQTLRKVSAHLGEEVVVQTPFGDSGHTTFFIANEDDWSKHADEIIREPEVKVMKRIKCRGSALEACVTKHGTIVGPLMTELVGFPELTPYKGGWCGNEVCADAIPKRHRDQARDKAFALGEELRRLGYRGYFEIDFLTDLKSGNLYLGEINPRVTGASSMTNLACFAHSDAPLFLFHLLEWSDVDFRLDIAALNRRWSDPASIDDWSQMVIKHTDDTVEQVTAAPRTGVWRLFGGGGRSATAEFLRVRTHRRTVEREDEAFFLRIMRPGDFVYKGADLGILVTPGRLMDENFQLTDRARAWIAAIRAQFATAPIGAEKFHPIVQPADVGSFKFL